MLTTVGVPNKMFFQVITFFILTAFCLSIENHGTIVLYSDTSDTTCLAGGLPVHCKVAHIKVEKFTHSILFDTLVREDDNQLVRRIQIDYHVAHINVEELDGLVDDFLTPRLWWSVISQNKVGKNLAHIILLRQGLQWEPALRLLGALQFPPESICSQSSLLLGHMVDSGWGSQAGMYGYFSSVDEWKILNIWDSYFNYKNESTLYVNASVCPDMVNKRTCAFLPMTNCTMPRVLTDSIGVDVPSKLWPSDFMKYSSASADGVPIADDSPAAEQWGKMKDIGYFKDLHTRYWNSRENPFQTNVFMGGDWKESHTAPNRQGPPQNPFVRPILFVQSLVFRPNAHFRRMLFKRIADYRSEHSFPTSLNSECVAVHIRRGDRTLPNLNMTDFCYQWVIKKDDTCYNRTDPSITNTACSMKLGDFGCMALKPFGGLSLSDYLEAASKVHTGKVAFILTDDKAWLDAEWKKLANHTVWGSWTLHSLPSTYGRYDTFHQTENGVDYLASIALARHCNAFVGHFWSGFTLMLHDAMCYQRGTTTGHCPATVDVGRVYTEEGNDVQSCRICEAE